MSISERRPSYEQISAFIRDLGHLPLNSDTRVLVHAFDPTGTILFRGDIVSHFGVWRETGIEKPTDGKISCRLVLQGRQKADS
jgi:hypothetical protein